jgi:serine/threonine-protein kinase HipA
MHLEDGTRELAGVLGLGDAAADGRYRAEFRYERTWLKSKRGFALDPESLPLSNGIFAGSNLNPPLGVFNDALPDRWGRSLLLRGLPLSQRSDLVLFTLRGRNGLGSIEFIEYGSRPPSPKQESTLSLETLLDSAEKFEAGLPVDDPHLRRLLAAGTTAGGARPKVTLSDESGDWIVKFPSKILDGRYDMVGLEKATMDCARAAGMKVPDTRIEYVGAKRVLFVKRFDITRQGGRRHMISLSTLCKERSDYAVSGYDDLADAVRKHSAAPSDDLAALFRHALFNGLVGNTDDHLKNFALLYDTNGYRLTPAYDLLPDTNANQEHVLFYGGQRYMDARTTVIDMARRWGIANPLDILRDVAAGLSGFKELSQRWGVPDANVNEITRDLHHRLGRVADST